MVRNPEDRFSGDGAHIRSCFSRSEEVDVMISPEDYSKAIGGLRELMSSVCDHCHDRCVKVMTARAKVGQGHDSQS